MQTIRVSATHARNNFFELLEKVALGDQVLVEKDRKLVAAIVPRKTKVDWKGLKIAMDAAHGILKDYDLSKSPLRGRKSKTWLARASRY
ncbi:hypothetical protein A3D84_05700 [Candidatus Woesebacteria bacterium RIFCSPHIGHO2_02_FULL_42_20]|uniref:Antitoxin n=1 Tax=Candidatus Woesebacteria bacterium RIFCSPHIGHO2_12_FULL_41_24 TaxID=1802510 RepID=A0A1F8ATR7_9BACT|nr:MAG: hypothetical protein A2W15_01260 [Candidatus Woesebacteria bacterium RBG_16_41_13]OGM30399.1 MAG: hypothetical protein A2873_00385 [Candidatus Woesebacteria bacterium RIFCSPHIGHO2_01_FULL_42_80]OGM35445.1 MAG: hypothetical protein A3D84_05700 [Candidatus Woesebacteria bacterium RIFCSPHIGHO2_02_FULL_42_20]OGM55020.1 MAG: hypothetical protein A3E44_04685 [Candidatus Woesebacteria bacterium RIFCSPHIGHO2_12_FULL_41_24]OGM66366.1 MAG: hypothetical protein A2969_00305 [Candidatus Woesebacteri